MKAIILIFLCICLTIVCTEQSLPQKPIVVITASYNNHDWVARNIESLFAQSYDNWRLIYIDDCSTDDTVALVEQEIVQWCMDDKVTFVKNKERRGHLANQYDAIHSCAPHEIVFILDGDDWLAHDEVLSTINRVYSSHDVWITWGQFWYYKKDRKGICKPLPLSVLEQGTARDFRPWCLSHPRTFYAGLFQLIRVEDLYYKGDWFFMCADVATMFPMVEMAGTHAAFIDEILYVYNDGNSLCFYHEKASLQREIEQYIRQKERYKPLAKEPYEKI